MIAIKELVVGFDDGELEPSPSGSWKRRRPSSRADSTPRARRLSSQKSSASPRQPAT